MSKYETHVKPRFSEIEKWIGEGATQAIVAKKLGITERTLRTYLKKFSDFSDLYKKRSNRLSRRFTRHSI